MIRLTRSQLNNISVTLNEKTTITPVYYYMEFYSNENGNSKAVYLGVDQSTNPVRWNEFQITEGVDDLDNDSILLTSGTYDYFAWECSAQDFTTKVSIVESGKCVVEGTEPVTTTFTDEPTEHTFNG